LQVALRLSWRNLFSILSLIRKTGRQSDSICSRRREQIQSRRARKYGFYIKPVAGSEFVHKEKVRLKNQGGLVS
jgi:hypothetical protein